MDRDRSGVLSIDELNCAEFRAIIRAALLSPDTGQAGTSPGSSSYTRSQMNMEQAISFFLRKADLNGDSVLAFEEFSAFIYALRQRNERSSAHVIFALFDLDSDKRLSGAEFREVYRYYLGHSPPEEEFQAEWARLDKDLTGQVTKQQYLRWLSTSANPIFKRHACNTPTATESGADTPQARSSTSGWRTVSRKSRQMEAERPKWNQRFNFNAGKNPNFELPALRRNYFARPQSMPELHVYLRKRRGCHKNLEKFERFELDIKPVRVLSTDTELSAGVMIAGRTKPGGTMKDHATGNLKLWDEHWQKPKALVVKPEAGAHSLRCPGMPPPWIRYEEDFDNT